jgi:hypothetical protein
MPTDTGLPSRFEHERVSREQVVSCFGSAREHVSDATKGPRAQAVVCGTLWRERFTLQGSNAWLVMVEQKHAYTMIMMKSRIVNVIRPSRPKNTQSC